MGLNWRSWLAHEKAIQLAAVSAAIIGTLPSLSIGWIADDYQIRADLLGRLTGQNTRGSWWNVFETDVPVSTLVSFGGLPWWTSPSLTFALLRPFATLSHYFDYLLWPEHPLWMHVHNIAIYALVVWVASGLYERLFESRAVAGVASMLYAVDDAHTFSTAWISSRNTLLTALFSLGAFSCFQRSRSQTSRLAVWGGPIALLLAHASSEGAIGIWAYLLAYVGFLDRAPLRDRVRALLPYFAVSAACLILSTAVGYGVRGSGVYLDPRADPLGFLRALVTRLPQSVLAEFSVIPELSISLPPPVGFAASAVGVLAFMLACILAIRSKHSVARLLLCGCVGALIPTCTLGATGRLLYLGGFGAQGLIALVCVTCFASAPRERLATVRRFLGIVFVAAGTSIAVFGAYTAPHWWLDVHKTFRRVARSLPSGAGLTESLIMIVNARDYFATPFVISYHRLFDAPGPSVMHVLGVSTHAVRVSRPDSKAIELEPDGGYLTDPTSVLVRPREEPFVVGQAIPLFGALVTVQKITADGRPARIRVTTFGADDPRLVWVAWNFERDRFERIAIPSVGGTLVLPGEATRAE
jgi:hypothetical protein